MSTERYHRNMLLFGAEGQAKLRATRTVVVGVGGLGSPLVQHLALLGVGGITLIEPESLEDTNRNRFIGARTSDPVPGTKKTFIAHRLISETNPDVEITVIPNGLVSPLAFAAIKEGDWIFGSFDHDGPRYILNELCAAYAKPYIDLASDVPEDGVYGGRVCVARNGGGCLCCRDLLDMKDVEEFLASAEQRAVRDKIYGISKDTLAEKKGPSVAPLNGVVASLAAIEFMVAVTDLRAPRLLLNYYGHLGKMTDGSNSERSPDCQFCRVIRGQREAADVERYLRIPHLHRDLQHSH